MRQAITTLSASALLLIVCCAGEDAGWSSESGKVQTVSELRLVQSHGGVRDWMLTGDSAVYREEDSLLLITGVDIVFYENDLPRASSRATRAPAT